MRLPPKTWVEVSGAALRHNAAALKKALARDTQLMAVVKSNAYGHGLAETVTALRSSVHWFGVDSLPEAQVVRRVAPHARILILGVTPRAWLGSVGPNMRLSISSPEQVKALVASNVRATIHLEIETGLTRQGIEVTDLPPLLRLLSKKKKVTIEGMFMHFSNVDVDGMSHPYGKKQISRFLAARRIAEDVLGKRVPITHAACSAAGLLFPETHFNLVRGGIALYGYWPSHETQQRARISRPHISLRPALTWKTTVAQVKYVTKGTPVGYGRKARMPHAGHVAVLPVGYWDGYDRGLASIGQVVIRKKCASIIGRICMNMCMVNVQGIKGVKAGDEVVLLGGAGQARVSAEFIGEQIGTISYEVLTRINPLIPRILV